MYIVLILLLWNKERELLNVNNLCFVLFLKPFFYFPVLIIQLSNSVSVYRKTHRHYFVNITLSYWLFQQFKTCIWINLSYKNTKLKCYNINLNKRTMMVLISLTWLWRLSQNFQDILNGISSPRVLTR
jgi:hypothetical protein